MRNRTKDQIILVMIRHGATKFNQEHRYLGKTEEPLSAEGIKELLLYKAQGYYPDIDILFTSPMKRCLQTSGILFSDSVPVCIEEWEEIDFGAFEGKNYRELQGDVWYQKWIDSNGTLPFPGGEHRDAFIRRCGNGFEKMIMQVKETKSSGKIRRIGMVVHGGTIMALLSKYCGGEYFSYQAANGRGYICNCNLEKSGPRLTGVKKL